MWRKTGTILNKEILVHRPKFKSVFSGVGRFPVEPGNIQLSDNALPVQKPARCVPMSLKDKYEQEIHSMEKQDIISKLEHNQTTEWLNSFDVVKKLNGDLRICLDPTDLNKCIVRPVCNLNTFDEVSFKIKDAKFSLIFDASKGFVHLPLNEKSKLLTAMLTPLGVYIFNALANWSFQLKLFVWICFKGIIARSERHGPHCWCYFGLWIHQQEHDSNVITFLKRCLEVDLKLNPSKIRLNCSEVPFLGKHISAEGIKPDLNKVKAIKDWPIPSNVKELQSFLRSVNYVSLFVPELSSLRTPLQPLVKTNTDFIWLKSHTEALKGSRIQSQMIVFCSSMMFHIPYCLNVMPSRQV